MNKRDLKKFEKQLLAERSRICSGINTLRADTLYQQGTEEHVVDPDDSAEAGTDSNQFETAMRLADSESELLSEIDAALDRVRNGTYGICEGTEKPIPKARLEAFPAARYCVEYQAELEKQGVMGGYR